LTNWNSWISFHNLFLSISSLSFNFCAIFLTLLWFCFVAYRQFYVLISTNLIHLIHLTPLTHLTHFSWVSRLLFLMIVLQLAFHWSSVLFC
jgi:hypothetical protein